MNNKSASRIITGMAVAAVFACGWFGRELVPFGRAVAPSREASPTMR